MGIAGVQESSFSAISFIDTWRSYTLVIENEQHSFFIDNEEIDSIVFEQDNIVYPLYLFNTHDTALHDTHGFEGFIKRFCVFKYAPYSDLRVHYVYDSLTALEHHLVLYYFTMQEQVQDFLYDELRMLFFEVPDGISYREDVEEELGNVPLMCPYGYMYNELDDVCTGHFLLFAFFFVKLIWA